MATRATAVGTQTGSDYLTAAEYNDASGGWIRWYEATSNQGSITTVTNLTGLTTTAWTVPDRTYRFNFDLLISDASAGAAEIVKILLLEDGSQIKQWNFPAAGTANDGFTCQGSMIYAPTAASHIYLLQAGRTGGAAGTFTLVASSTSPAQFWIEDVGP
jgi:hypothetical protein